MADFISRDKAVFYLKETAEGLHGTPLWAEFALHLEDDFKEFPAADVAPVNHGHWIRPDVPNTRSYKWQCSECGQIAYWLHYGNLGNKNIICKYSYCPNCGAKMDGDTNGC